MTQANQSENSNTMTLEKLANLMQKGFLELDQKLGGRIDKVESRIDKLENVVIRLRNESENKLIEINLNIHRSNSKMSDYMDHIYKKLEYLETENSAGFSQYKRHDETINDHESRLVKLETTS